ncbi:MAG: hypothetical protein WBN68_14420 [Sedimenticolaceae bacterium]
MPEYETEVNEGVQHRRIEIGKRSVAAARNGDRMLIKQVLSERQRARECKCRGHAMYVVKHLWNFAVIFAQLLAFGLISSPVSGETLYRITDLGDLPGGIDSSTAIAINESGLVVGWSEAETGTRAFLWESGVMTDLGDLSGGRDTSEARGINDAGQVVGRSEDEVSGRAFLWTAGSLTNLGALPGGSGNSSAYDINAAGQVVGRSVGAAPGGSVFGQATLWEPGGEVIRGLGDLPGGRDESTAHAINATGQVVGESDTSTGPHAILWEPGGSLTDLGDLPGGQDQSIAHDINNSGLIVGESQSADGQRAFLWNAGVMRDLGHLGGRLNRSMAYAINDADIVVGLSNSTRGDAGFIWGADSGMRDLNELIDPDDPVLGGASHLLLHGAKDINNSGQIVGQMSIDGVRHGYLLTPLSSADEVGIYYLWLLLLLILLLIILLLFLRRKRPAPE